jgi:phage shock protein C
LFFLCPKRLATFSRRLAYVKAKPESEIMERRALMNYKRLYRSNRDVMLGGVAAGLAEYFNLDPTIVRLLFVLLALVTVGFPMALVYLILWIIIPRAPAG